MSGIQVCVAFHTGSLHSQLSFLHVVIRPLCGALMVLRIQPSALCMLDKWASIPRTELWPQPHTSEITQCHERRKEM